MERRVRQPCQSGPLKRTITRKKTTLKLIKSESSKDLKKKWNTRKTVGPENPQRRPQKPPKLHAEQEQRHAEMQIREAHPRKCRNGRWTKNASHRHRRGRERREIGQPKQNKKKPPSTIHTTPPSIFQTTTTQHPWFHGLFLFSSPCKNSQDHSPSCLHYHASETQFVVM